MLVWRVEAQNPAPHSEEAGMALVAADSAESACVLVRELLKDMPEFQHILKIEWIQSLSDSRSVPGIILIAT